MTDRGLIASDTVCIVFAIDGISAKTVGVYENQAVALRRVSELRNNLGLLHDCYIEYQNEVVWRENRND